MPVLNGIDSSKMIKKLTLDNPNYYNPYILVYSGCEKN
jgi:hypothetical protein